MERQMTLIEQLSYEQKIASWLLIFWIFAAFVIVMLLLFSVINKKIGAIILVAMIMLLPFSVIIENEYLKKIEQARETTGYTYFLDGREVDINKIDISQYQCTYDDENQRVFMTNKR